jgi:hypothetical protein
VTSLDDRRRAERERPHQALVAVVRQVVVETDGIGHADARDGQPLLLREIRNFFDQTHPQRVLAARQKIGIEQRPHVGRGHRAVADPAARERHLHERLEPDHAARPVADDRDVHLSSASFIGDRHGDLFGAEGQRRGIPRDVNRRRRHYRFSH